MRIISMILVLITHASYISIDPPTQAEISASFGDSFCRGLCESLSKVCVNAFVLISGWYGIHGGWHKFLQLLFQVIFVSISVYFVMRMLGLTNTMTFGEWIGLILAKHRGYWFVRAYIVLYVFAPVLNAFVENVGKKQMQIFLLFFYSVQLVYGFYNYGDWYAGGYSPLSFMGLYVLAHYIRTFPDNFTQLDKATDLLIYLTLSVVLTLCSLSLTFLYDKGGTILFLYSSPLVILSSVYFFLFFTKLSFRSSLVNWISVSSFTVYLIHTSPFIFHPYYIDVIKQWFDVEPRGQFLLYTSGLIIVFFVVSVLFDKIRIIVWNCMLKLFVEVFNK